MLNTNVEQVAWDTFKLGKSGRNVKLLYGKEPVRFCTSTLYTPFGVKSIDKEWSNFTEYSVDCSLNNSSNESATSFRMFLERLDLKIQELVKENKDLFAKGANEQFSYTNILRENGSYPKLMKLQFVRDKNGNFESFIFDDKKNKVSISESNLTSVISKGKNFKCIIECSKVWFYNGKVGTIWNIVQLKLSEKQIANNNTPSSYDNLMILD